MSSFCSAKATHIFSAKHFSIFAVSLAVNFNESLTNDVVSFEQLGPDISTDLFCLFVCVEVLWPSQPNGVMSSIVSLPNNTFSWVVLTYLPHILEKICLIKLRRPRSNA